MAADLSVVRSDRAAIRRLTSVRDAIQKSRADAQPVAMYWSPPLEPILDTLDEIRAEAAERNAASDSQMQAIAAENAELTRRLQALTESAAAPVEVVERDGLGRIAKLRKGGREMRVERGTDGRPVALV